MWITNLFLAIRNAPFQGAHSVQSLGKFSLSASTTWVIRSTVFQLFLTIWGNDPLLRYHSDMNNLVFWSLGYPEPKSPNSWCMDATILSLVVYATIEAAATAGKRSSAWCTDWISTGDLIPERIISLNLEGITSALPTCARSVCRCCGRVSAGRCC